MLINILLISIPLLIVSAIVIANIKERYDWNNGYCRKCNRKWRQIEINHIYKERDYICPCCGKRITIYDETL